MHPTGIGQNTVLQSPTLHPAPPIGVEHASAGDSRPSRLPRALTAGALLPLLVCAAPFVLLLDFSRAFQVDWVNHTWLIAYHGVSLIQRYRVPEVLHTGHSVGIVDPAFYGHTLYTLLGLLSVIVGPELALRLGIFLSMLIQYREVQRTVALAADRVVSHTVAILVCWAIYPLTNVYTRSAMTEYFAVCLLTCATCALIRLFLADDHPAKNAAAARFTMYFALAALSHPITALYGGTFLLVFGATAILVAKDRLAILVRLAIAGAVAAIILSPWLYVVARFKSELQIQETLAELRPLESDALWFRLLPFPLDPRSVRNGIHDVSTPYLNAQINTPLLLLALVLASILIAGFWRRRRGPRLAEVTGVVAAQERRARDRLGWALCAAGAALAGIALVVSSFESLAARVPELFKSAQFAYRLVTYVNLGLLVCVFGLLLKSRTIDLASARVRHACAALMTIGALAIVQQQIYAVAISVPAPSAVEQHVIGLPQAYPAGQYSIVTGIENYPPPLPPVNVSLLTYGGRRFGEVAPVTVRLDRPAMARTNVMPFPWNQLTLDGRPIEKRTLRYWYPWLVVDLPAGTHELGYRFVPDPAWRVLRVISWVALGLLAAVNLMPLARRRPEDAPAGRREDVPGIDGQTGNAEV